MSDYYEWIQDCGPLFHAYHGYYVLPLAGMALAALRYLISHEGIVDRLGPALARAGRAALLGLLAATAVVSVGAYNNFFNYHYGSYLNAYEFFHYYLGSKYSREVGYFDMYGAALLADAETGRVYWPADRTIRDLRTHRYRDVGHIFMDQERYRGRFSDARWREWVDDVFFFKRKLGTAGWNRILRDRGYNATPVWTMIGGGLLSQRVPTSSEAGMTALAALDVVLLAGAVLCVAWVFGRWPALLAIVFLASSYLMAHVHMKGAFLRTDFAVCLVLAVCALKKRRHGLAGALVGFSALSRIFPAVFLFGPLALFLWELFPVFGSAVRSVRRRFGAGHRGRAAVGLLAVLHLAVGAALSAVLWTLMGPDLRELAVERWGGSGSRLVVVAAIPAAAALMIGTCAVWGWTRRMFDPAHLRFLAGFAVLVAVLVPASMVYAGGPGVWSDFALKIAVHRAEYHVWNVGLPSVVMGQVDSSPADEPATSPFGRIRNTRFVLPEKAEQEHAAFVRLIQLGALLLCFFAARGLEPHRALALGFVPTFYLIAPTYYYYIVLLLPFLFLAERSKSLLGALGLVYLFLFGMAGHWWYQRWEQYFTTYYWNSVLALILAVYMMAVAFTERRAT